MVVLTAAAMMLSTFVGSVTGLADTDTITWGGDNSRAGYQTNHNMDPEVVASDQFAQLFKTRLPGSYNGANEQIFSQPLVYTPSGGDGTQYVYFATTQNNVYKLDAKTGEIVASRNLHIPFLTADLDGCVDINPLVGVTSTGVIDPDTDTLYLTSKTYENQEGGTAAQGRPAGRYYFHAIDVNDLTERENFPVDLEGTVARNNPIRSFNGGIHHQRPALLHSGQYIYAGFASHCVQYNFTGWIMGWDKTTGAIVERWATEGQGVPNTTPGGGVWMSGGGLASDDAGSMYFATGNGYASQLADVPVNGRDPPTSLEEAAVHMTINDDGSLTIVDFFMPYEKQALDGADKDLGTSPLEILPSEFACGEYTRIGVVTGKSGKTYWINLDDMGGYKNGANAQDAVIQTYQNENSVYAGAGVYPLEGGYIYINVINYPSHVFQFSCTNGVPSFTKVADSPASNAGILGVSHGTVTSLDGQAGTGLVWTTDVQGDNLRIYKAIPENGYMTLIKSFSVPGTTKFTRAVFGDGIVYQGTTQGYVYGFGAPTNPPLNCTTPIDFGTSDIDTATAETTITCTAKIGVTVTAVDLNSTDFGVSGLPTVPLTLAAGAGFSFKGYFDPSTIGLLSDSVVIDTTNTESGYSVVTNVRLTGTGQSEDPLLAISPTTLTFSKVITGSSDSGTDQSVLFTNQGNNDLTISSIQYSTTGFTGPFVDPTTTSDGPQVGSFTFKNLPATIAANTDSTVTVNFNPTEDGNSTVYVVVDSDGGKKNLTVTGSSGPAPVAKLEFQTPDGTGWVTYESGTNFTFGNVTENTTRSLKLRLTNAGGDNAVTLSVTVSKPPFGVSGIIGAANQVDLAEGTELGSGESATATLYCSVPKSQWNVDPYLGTAQWTMNTNDPDFSKQYMQFACTAVSEQAPPLRADGQGEYRYIGCYKENNPGRQLTTQLYGDDANTNAMCIAACADAGYAYCGTQYQRECWGGNTIPTLEVDDDDCNYACSGDINQVCGGNGVGDDAGGAFISLFATDDAPTGGGDGDGAGDGDGSGSGSTLVTNPGVDGFFSYGCYAEPSSGRALSSLVTTENKTVTSCVEACSSYKYLGLEYGGECWCGNTLNSKATQVNLTDCNMACTGNTTEYCGGSSRLNLYAKNGTTPGGSTGPTNKAAVGSYGFQGCYTEATSSRALSSSSYADDSMTLESCAAFCDGYTYFGAEYGRECYCGNVINNGSVLADDTSDCDFLCAGDDSEYCGGSSRLNLYKLGDSSPSSAVSSAQSTATAAATSTPSPVISSTENLATSTILSSSQVASSSVAPSLSVASSTSEASTSSPASSSIASSTQIGLAAPSPSAISASSTQQSSSVVPSSVVSIASSSVISSTSLSSSLVITSSSIAPSLSSTSSVAVPSSSATPSLFSTSSIVVSTSSSLAPSLSSTSSTSAPSPTSLTSLVASSSVLSSSTVASSSSSTSAAASVYTGPPVFSEGNVNFTFYSCVSEPSSGRLLPNLVSDDTKSATIESCLAVCWMYNYAGIEYGSECWCGNTLNWAGNSGATPGANVSGSDCSFTCPGNSSEYCGAGVRLSMYAKRGMATLPV